MHDDDLSYYLRHYVDEAPRTMRGKSTRRARATDIARRKARAYKQGATRTTKSGRAAR